MKTTNRNILIVVIILIVLILIGVAVHDPSKKKVNNTSTSTTTSKTTDSAVVNNAVLKTKTGTSFGSYLTEPNGAPLYTYASDTANTSNCSGSCITAWPAYVDSGSTSGLPANIGTIKRSDSGEDQYTYKGLPLYTFASDTGTTPTGNNVGGFTLARP